jgi:predicted patatin/cPLA2 family phospholipase
MSIYTQEAVDKGKKFLDKPEQTIAQVKKRITRMYPAKDYKYNEIGLYHRRASAIFDSANYLTEKQYDSLMSWVNN